MKIDFLKTIDAADNFYGVSLIAENLREKQLVKKMINANYVFKNTEKQIANLARKQVVITIEITNTV